MWSRLVKLLSLIRHKPSSCLRESFTRRWRLRSCLRGMHASRLKRQQHTIWQSCSGIKAWWNSLSICKNWFCHFLKTSQSRNWLVFLDNFSIKHFQLMCRSKVHSQPTTTSSSIYANISSNGVIKKKELSWGWESRQIKLNCCLNLKSTRMLSKFCKKLIMSSNGKTINNCLWSLNWLRLKYTMLLTISARQNLPWLQLKPLQIQFMLCHNCSRRSISCLVWSLPTKRITTPHIRTSMRPLRRTEPWIIMQRRLNPSNSCFSARLWTNSLMKLWTQSILTCLWSTSLANWTQWKKWLKQINNSHWHNSSNVLPNTKRISLIMCWSVVISTICIIVCWNKICRRLLCRTTKYKLTTLHNRLICQWTKYLWNCRRWSSMKSWGALWIRAAIVWLCLRSQSQQICLIIQLRRSRIWRWSWTVFMRKQRCTDKNMLSEFF